MGRFLASSAKARQPGRNSHHDLIGKQLVCHSQYTVGQTGSLRDWQSRCPIEAIS
jgi:hypothetical protein